MAERKAVVALIAVLSCVSSARAQDDEARATARALANEGGVLYEEGNFSAALDKLDKAYAVLKVPTLGYWSARCLEQVGRWVEAAARYDEVTQLPLPSTSTEHHERAQKDAADARRALLPRIPKIVVVVSGEPGEVRVDTRPVVPEKPLLLDPGKHVVELHSGARHTERTVVLEEGKTERVELRIEPVKAPVVKPQVKPHAPRPQPPPERASPWRTVGWASLGVGIAGSATAIGTGIALLVIKSRLDDACVDDACVPSAESDVDSFNALRPVTTVSMVVGAAGLAAGVALLVTTEGGPAVALAPWGAGVRWRF